MKFVKLTTMALDSSKYPRFGYKPMDKFSFVNVCKIKYFHQFKQDDLKYPLITEIDFGHNESDLYVLETPEEILALINEG